MAIEEPDAEIELPMERPLFTPPLKPVIANTKLEIGESDLDLTALYSQIVINKRELASNIRRALQTQSQISLRDLLNENPLKQGLAELLGYLQVAGEWAHTVVEEETHDVVEWSAGDGIMRKAKLPRIIFARH
jgi:hypothetical protein